MAEFLKTDLTLAEFKEMVKESKDVDVDVNLATIADERLYCYCRTEGCPAFYYLKDIGDKDYVVEKNGDTAIISEVVEIDDETGLACHEYLKQKSMKCDSEENCSLVHTFTIIPMPPRAIEQDDGNIIYCL